MSINETLETRGSVYGDYATQANVVEGIIAVIRDSTNWERLPDTHRVALYLIALKIGRICTGDINHVDSWHDIQGYAQLVEREIKK